MATEMTDHPALAEIRSRLPPLKVVEARTEADYYGATYLIASQMGLPEPPPLPLATWAHGIRMRDLFCPAEILWMKEPSHYKIVHRESEAQYLKAAGVTGVRVAGAPFLYTDALERCPRIPNSILIMPGHSLRETDHDWNCAAYAERVAELKERFDLVAACVYHSCIEKGLWIHDFERWGIPWFRGAQSSDMNSLIRMRALFDSFEQVTTNTIGSHIPYMLYTGGRASIWGEMIKYYKEDLKDLGIYKANPELLDLQLEWGSEESIRRTFPWLFRDPWEAEDNKAWADEMMGAAHRVELGKLKRFLGWGADQQFREHMRVRRKEARERKAVELKAKLKEKKRLEKKKLQDMERRRARKQREKEERRRKNPEK